MSVDYHVAQYAKIVEDLKVEIQQLKDKIVSLEEENLALKNQVRGFLWQPWKLTLIIHIFLQEFFSPNLAEIL